MKTYLFICLIIIFLCHVTFAAVVTNITSGGPEYATVSAAVSAAVSGDTLLLSTGVFAETVNIQLGKQLTFRGGYLLDFSGIVPGEKSVIDSTGNSVIDVMSAGSILNLFDIELTGCASGFGGGIDYYDGTTGALINCYIHNNQSTRAGGIYVQEKAYVVMTNTVVAFNNSSSYGGGIAVDGGMLVVAQNCYIRDNISVNMGGGIYANDANVWIQGTNTYLGIFYFWSGMNQCTNGDGGGMYAVNSDIVLSGAQCYAGYNYSSRDGGAFYLTNSSLSLLDGAQINFGWTSRNGGGIYAVDSEIVMDDAAIMYCGATNGAGIYVASCTGSFLTAGISNNTANASSGNGGGIYVTLTGSYNFTNSSINNNSAQRGGGIYARDTAGDFVLNNSVIANNSAYQAGGICARDTAGDFVLNNSDVIYNHATGYEGGVYWNSLATLEMNNCRLNHNVSDNNIGAAFCSGGVLSFRNTEISYNLASNSLAGIGVDSDGLIECIDCDINCNISDAASNNAPYGGAVYAEMGCSAHLISLNGIFTITNNSAAFGGAVYAQDNGHISIYGDVLIADNRATLLGGGIFATNKSSVTLMPTNGFAPRVINNFANENGGGAAIFAGSEITAVNSRFEGNLCSNSGGAMFVYEGTATVYGAFSGGETMPPCVFADNNARHGGAIYGRNSTLLNISDSLFVSNSAFASGGGYGGALYSVFSSIIDIENSIIANNSALNGGSGGAIYVSTLGFLDMKQCTVNNNSLHGITGNIISITNSIIWGNDGMEISPGKDVNYCDVDGGYATGVGNLNVNPMFEDPAALNFRLAIGSPCIDTGAVINVNTDCIGNPRPMGLGFDLGAYELDPTPILDVTPLELDFGDVVLGDNADWPVTVGNLGNSLLDGNVINIMTPPFSIISGSPYSLLPLSTNIVTFRYSPQFEVPRTNIVTFQSNGGNINVTLIGNGIPEPGILWIIGLLEFWICYRKFFHTSAK